VDPAAAKMAVQIAATLGRNRGFRYLLVGLVVLALAANLALVFGPWMLTTQMSAALRGQQQSLSAGGSCATPTGVVNTEAASAGSLSAAQVGNARTIWKVGEQMGAGDRGGVVGIATALQESTLKNLSYGDRDSVGLFQQRASWGSVETRMDPPASARLFYAALLEVPGWKGMTVTRAAQAVQRSAFPDAYAKHEKAATGLVALFKSKAPSGSTAAVAAMGSAMCGNADAAQCPTTGMGIEAGLMPDALRVLRCLKQQWPQLSSFGGIGNRPSNVDRDHQEGRAIDAMVPDYESAAGKQLGQTIASWVVANQSRLGVRYVIWNARIWNVQRASDGWRTCGSQASCYAGSDDTAAHRDHVHISVFGDQAAAPVTAATGPVVRPLDRYLLTARFGECSSHWASCHTGLDFSAATGVPIRAIMGGRVTWTTWGGAYGNLTKIEHPSGVQSWYAHQSSRRVRVGDTVTAGQVIGTVGATGNVTGPHLHLEVRLNGTPADPDRWLSARGVAP
jgi:hypothetical protein